MRHVTDGELHAFLDGALDLLPDRRGEEVRIHLSECPACRERLQDEESVRSRAVEILGDPEVESVALPTFEELRERAEASGSPWRDRDDIHYRGPLRGVPLAWAATVVLALGVGWMGGELWRSLPRSPGVGPRPTEAVNPRSAAPEAERAQYSVGATPETTPERAAGAEAASTRLARPGTAMVRPPVEVGEALALNEMVVAEGARGDSVDQRGGRGETVGQGSARGETVGAEPARGETAVEELARRVRADRFQPPPDSSIRSRGDPGIRDLEARREAPAPRPELAEEASLAALQEELEKSARPEENSFAVPGLKVLSVEWEEWIPGERALRIRQLLSTGDTLELRYLGLLMGAEPAGDSGPPSRAMEQNMANEVPVSPVVLEASLPPGWNQVEMRWGRGWLVARAPLPEESIKALLRLLR